MFPSALHLEQNHYPIGPIESFCVKNLEKTNGSVTYSVVFFPFFAVLDATPNWARSGNSKLQKSVEWKIHSYVFPCFPLVSCSSLWLVNLPPLTQRSLYHLQDIAGLKGKVDIRFP